MSEPRGIINLIHRAPLDMTYQHQIDFKSPSEQLAYWGSKIKYSLSDYTYIRRERRSIKVNKSFDELEGINYLIYQAHSGDGTKYYYCFVTDRAYVNDKTTAIFFEIDVFQTYMFDFTFKPSYISQAHVDRWGADHKPIYSRTEEGLNYGSEYVTEKAYKIKPDADTKHGFYLVYCVEHNSIIASGVASEPTRCGSAPTPYSIYLVPTDETKTDTGFNHYCEVSYHNDSGDLETQIVCSLGGLQRLMNRSAFGEFIKAIIYVPYSPIKYTINKPSSPAVSTNFTFLEGIYGVTSITSSAQGPGSAEIGLLKIKDVDSLDFKRVIAEADRYIGLENALPTEEMWSTIKSKPRTTERDRRYESKLLCYPYRYNLLTDWVNTPALIKNEYLTGDKLTLNESFSFGFNFPRRYYLNGYRKDPEGRESSVSQLTPFEQPIFSDAYYTYMLQNKNQISANLTNAKNSAITSGIIGATNGIAGGVLGGLMAGGPVGAVSAGVSSALSVGANIANSVVNINNMMRSENAKQKDIQALPDTVVNSNDCSMAIMDDTKYLTWYRKAICCEFQEQLAQYWHMFGYKVNRLETPNLRSRVRYNYIKTIGANIEGAIEGNYLSILKAIFDAGITIWHYSESDFNPLDYSYENPEVLLL